MGALPPSCLPLDVNWGTWCRIGATPDMLLALRSNLAGLQALDGVDYIVKFMTDWDEVPGSLRGSWYSNEWAKRSISQGVNTFNLLFTVSPETGRILSSEPSVDHGCWSAFISLTLHRHALERHLELDKQLVWQDPFTPTGGDFARILVIDLSPQGKGSAIKLDEPSCWEARRKYSPNAWVSNSPSVEHLEAEVSLKTMPHSQSVSWVGLRGEEESQDLPDDVETLVNEHGWEIIEWDGSWEAERHGLKAVCDSATLALSETARIGLETGAFILDDLKHRGGWSFFALPVGTSYGGGQEVPGHLVHPRPRERLAQSLLKNPDLRRIAGFQSTTGISRLRRSGHLKLYNIKKAIQFPHCSALIPSAFLAHGNSPLQIGETRYSVTQYASGDLFRWAAYGFRSGVSFDSTKPGKAKRNGGEDVCWPQGLDLFSKYDELFPTVDS
ncbi:hypothetical protein FA13DRAFT_1712919 [Coprinellus micaceus]|uniref:Uncharacterized protein n=1 Tax=Coprinellus micaceus TaxID=71717 RepID=A0A4Y7SYL2_COPMI|nr:hypothetical protein FA13DRAFT_1712919 [Coprinellus micaceus]